MRLIFMGTPDFAVMTLKALIAAGHEIVCVYSQPPRAKGRGLGRHPTPVEVFAQISGLKVLTPSLLSSSSEQEKFADCQADAAVVVAYGLLLPKAILDAPKFGCFNVHASLLPRWRGAAPIQRAIMAGDRESGVSIMRMEPGLDTGPVMMTKRVLITPQTTASSLHDALAVAGAELMVEVLQHPQGSGVPQSDIGITYARKIAKMETAIDFTKTAAEVRNHIHGLSATPGAWCLMNGARVKILQASIGEGLLNFKCGEGSIQFTRLQREGKGPMDAATFLRGFPNPRID